MRIDRADDCDERPDTPGASGARGADDVHSAEPVRGAAAERDGAGRGDDASADRVARNLEYRAKVEAVDRADAIDQGYARVQEIEEKTVTPAMRRIEAADPNRTLTGLEHRLKGKDRLTEKVASQMLSNAELSADQALANVKDAIRYTFTYSEAHYTEGVRADVGRMKERFDLVDLRNSWPGEEYKGINSRWRVPENNQLFEVQFHTRASFEAKQLTHVAYEKIRDPATSKGEREKLQDFQRQVSVDIPVPADVSDIPDYP
jgi:hypothetical protein